jgi:hypothetical protein
MATKKATKKRMTNARAKQLVRKHAPAFVEVVEEVMPGRVDYRSMARQLQAKPSASVSAD